MKNSEKAYSLSLSSKLTSFLDIISKQNNDQCSWIVSSMRPQSFSNRSNTPYCRRPPESEESVLYKKIQNTIKMQEKTTLWLLAMHYSDYLKVDCNHHNCNQTSLNTIIGSKLDSNSLLPTEQTVLKCH